MFPLNGHYNVSKESNNVSRFADNWNPQQMILLSQLFQVSGACCKSSITPTPTLVQRIGLDPITSHFIYNVQPFLLGAGLDFHSCRCDPRCHFHPNVGFILRPPSSPLITPDKLKLAREPSEQCKEVFQTHVAGGSSPHLYLLDVMSDLLKLAGRQLQRLTRLPRLRLHLHHYHETATLVN